LTYSLPPVVAGQGFRLTTYFQGGSAGVGIPTYVEYFLSSQPIGTFNPSLFSMENGVLEALVVNLNGTQTSQVAITKATAGTGTTGAIVGPGPQFQTLALNFAAANTLQFLANWPSGSLLNAWWIIEVI
jgi:hypothetical protein